ncbi:hypothetical protein [Streptomyces thermolilacinus]|uniref:hypothetical protein n=1 Tax=Streptomyces thermolilacinus TaxID=285540 RepID=UPI0033E05701
MPKKRRPARRKPPRATAPNAMTRKHADYRRLSTDEQLVEEFGEEAAQWLLDEYEGPLNVAEFKLEQAIRRDSFIMDNPLAGPTVCTARQIGQMIDDTLRSIAEAADQAGKLTADQAREVEELLNNPLDLAENHADVVREAHVEGVILLNSRDLWSFT